MRRMGYRRQTKHRSTRSAQLEGRGERHPFRALPVDAGGDEAGRRMVEAHGCTELCFNADRRRLEVVATGSASKRPRDQPQPALSAPSPHDFRRCRLRSSSREHARSGSCLNRLHLPPATDEAPPATVHPAARRYAAPGRLQRALWRRRARRDRARSAQRQARCRCRGSAGQAGRCLGAAARVVRRGWLHRRAPLQRHRLALCDRPADWFFVLAPVCLPGLGAALAVAADAHVRLPHLPRPERAADRREGVRRFRSCQLQVQAAAQLPRPRVLRAVPRERLQLRRPAVGGRRHLVVLRAWRRGSPVGAGRRCGVSLCGAGLRGAAVPGGSGCCGWRGARPAARGSLELQPRGADRQDGAAELRLRAAQHVSLRRGFTGP